MKKLILGLILPLLIGSIRLEVAEYQIKEKMALDASFGGDGDIEDVLRNNGFNIGCFEQPKLKNYYWSGLFLDKLNK